MRLDKIKVTYVGNDFAGGEPWMDESIEVYLFRPNMTIQIEDEPTEANLAFRKYGRAIRDGDVINNQEEVGFFYDAYLPGIDESFIEENTALFVEFFEKVLDYVSE